MKRELIVSLVLLIGSIILYLILGHIEMSEAQTFPRFVIVIMGILSALLVLQSLTAKALASLKKAPFPVARFAICFILIIAYFVFMEGLGFYVSAFLFFVATTFILGAKDLTLRSGLIRAAAGFVFTIVLFILFNVLLAVQTPKGLLI